MGNPNAGKTTVFNALTGSHQKVGNYPGVTVERVTGHLEYQGASVEVLDVPGLYSLHASGEDEHVAVECIVGGKFEAKPDLLVVIVDASNLERNLYLYAQLAELETPMLVALTMEDRLAAMGLKLDLGKLANLLGAEVVVVDARNRRGIEDLKTAITRNLADAKAPIIDSAPPSSLAAKIASLRELMTRHGFDVTREEVREAIANPENSVASWSPEVHATFASAHAELGAAASQSPASPVEDRYKWSTMVRRAALVQVSPPHPSLTDRVDRILTHRALGFLIFVLVMYGVFLSIYTFSRPIMDGIQSLFDHLSAWVGPMLVGIPWLKSLVTDGLIAGVGSVMVFLPQIVILFFFVALLEGTGYLARAAFIVDRVFGWSGLNGRAFIPLLSSFACAIPGIMAARVMPDQRSRLATILVAPLMSCSARLPVYLLVIGAFVEPNHGALIAALTLYGMHILGLAIAVPLVWVFNKKMLKGKRLPFLLELPPYQWPKLRDMWLTMYFRGKVFVTTAGTVIVALSIVIWGLSYFPRSAEASARYRAEIAASSPGASQDAIGHYVEGRRLEDSYLGKFGRTLEPVFRPAGFDWRLTTAILSAFPARETVVPSLGILFHLGGGSSEGRGDLQQALQQAKRPDGAPLLTGWTAASLMVFFALCCQCASTLATIRRETNSLKWPAFVFIYMTVLAYLGSVLVFQVGRLFGGA